MKQSENKQGVMVLNIVKEDDHQFNLKQIAESVSSLGAAVKDSKVVKLEPSNTDFEAISTTFSEFSNADVMRKFKQEQVGIHGKVIIPKYLKEVNLTISSNINRTSQIMPYTLANNSSQVFRVTSKDPQLRSSISW